MFRKLLITLLGVALFSLTACGESKPESVPGNEYVMSVDVDTVLGNYKALHCKNGYQPFDLDASKGQYKILGMSVVVDADGMFYDDIKETEEYDGFYAQDWVSVKMTLLQNVELPVIIVHSKSSRGSRFDDQAITPEIGAGDNIDMRLVTDNYIGQVGKISSLTMCLKTT